jgi:Methyltransferase domain
VKLASVLAVLRGAGLAVCHPTLLAQLPRIRARDRSERATEQAARKRFGGVPRTVAFEEVVPETEACLPSVALLSDGSEVPDYLLLQSLATRFRQARAFEIGTFRGEGALALAAGGAEVVTLAPSEAQMRSWGNPPDYIQTTRLLSLGHPHVRHLDGDSRSIDLRPYERWADVIFIDGSHEREAVASDTRRAWQLRRHDRAVVVWHDGFHGSVGQPRWEVLAGIADGLPPGAESHVVHVSNTMCLAWLPEAPRLAGIARSYVPRVTFELHVKRHSRHAAPPAQDRPVLAAAPHHQPG